VTRHDVIEKALSTEVYQAIQNYSRHDERGQQTADYRAGISDLGFCSERLRRMLAQMDPEDSDLLAAFIGTAMGDHVERALAIAWPTAIIQPSVTVTLIGEVATYEVPGHPDVVKPEGLLIDVKTSRGLEVARRQGPSRQQQYQRHCYALGAFEAGLFDDDITLDDVKVANVWLDRAADEKEAFSHVESFDIEIVQEAAEWLDEVVYAFTHEQAARKEPAREVCKAVCGFFETCRALDTDVEGLLTDDTILMAIEMYEEGKALESRGRKLKDQAKGNLPLTASGSTGKHQLRWVWVNESEVHYTRRGYNKLDVRKM